MATDLHDTTEFNLTSFSLPAVAIIPKHKEPPQEHKYQHIKLSKDNLGVQVTGFLDTGADGNFCLESFAEE